MNGRRCLLLLGPTASGKTSIAEAAATKFSDLKLVNIDSTLKYRFANIGTAKPTALLHRYLGIDTHHPTQESSVQDTITTLSSTSDDCLLVGGSLFYARALLTGLNPMPENQGAINQFVKDHPEWTTRAIQKFNISGDPYRQARELAIILATGHRKETLQAIPRSPPLDPSTPVVIISPPRQVLHERIEQRTFDMLQNGLVEEVIRFCDAGWKHSFPMKFIGYKQCLDALEGSLPWRQLPERICQATNRLVRGQTTWIRQWLKQFPQSKVAETSDEALEMILKFPWR